MILSIYRKIGEQFCILSNLKKFIHFFFPFSYFLAQYQSFMNYLILKFGGKTEEVKSPNICFGPERSNTPSRVRRNLYTKASDGKTLLGVKA